MKLTQNEISEAVADPAWQAFRKTLKRRPIQLKLAELRRWKREHLESRRAQVQIQNYLNALRRAGFIVPNVEDL
jgi:hypothetical protein